MNLSRLLTGLWWFISGFSAHFALKHGLASQWSEMGLDLLMVVAFGLSGWIRKK